MKSEKPEREKFDVSQGSFKSLTEQTHFCNKMRRQGTKWWDSSYKNYRAIIVIKITCLWHKNWHADQWNWTEKPDISAHMYGYLIFDLKKNPKRHTEENKNSIFSKWCWSNFMASCRRIKIDPYCTKVNFIWVKDITIKIRCAEPSG